MTPAKRGKGNQTNTSDAAHGPTPAQRPAAMTWAQRLKRVFNIDIETGNTCGAHLKSIACIEDPLVIEKILTHLDAKPAIATPARLPPSRASLEARLFA